ncbi:hypothetical protein [Oceanicaulis alexandrii]|uniref:hypothetical protein n=1 Tax=Oceanicaulis alexandrii TaxID=153233 RepID=UPI003B509087
MAYTTMKFMETCPVCDQAFQFGPKRYEGFTLDAYDMHVCDRCEVGNHDGWSPHHEPKILEHLKAKNLPVPGRLPNGMLPFNPPKTRHPSSRT